MLTPLAIDPAHPFPSFPTTAFAGAGAAPAVRQSILNALLPFAVDAGTVHPPAGRGFALHQLENTITVPARLFPGYELLGWRLRLTRDGDIEIEEEAGDLVRYFESALKRRQPIGISSRSEACRPISSAW